MHGSPESASESRGDDRDPPTIIEKASAFGFSAQSWRRAGSEASWVVAGQVMTAIAGLVGVRVLTELATTQIMGKVSLLLGIFAIVRNVFVAPIGNVQIRFHPENAAAGRVVWFTGEIRRLTFAGAFAMTLVLLAAISVWKLLDPAVPAGVLMVLAVAYSGFDAARSVRMNQLQADRRRQATAVWTSAEAWLVFIGPALAILLQRTTESYLAGQAVASLAALLVFGVLLLPAQPPDARPAPVDSRAELLQCVRRYGLPFVPLAVVTWISNLGDRYIIGSILGDAQVGLYAAAYGLASRPFLMVGGILSGFARPILFEAEGRGDRRKGARVFWMWLAMTVLVSGAGILAFGLMGPLVARALLAPAFRHEQTTLIFLWVAGGYAFANISLVFENRILSLGLSRSLLFPAIAGAAVNIALNFFFIPRWQMTGAAAATTVSFFVQTALIAAALGLDLRAASGPPSARTHHGPPL